MIKDTGSNYNFADRNTSAKVGKSKFDLSYVTSFTADEGQLIPCYVEHTLLGDTFNLSNQSLVRVVNNPVVPLASRQRMFVHTYWASLPQLWKNAQSFFAKGYTNDDFKDISKDVTPKVWLKGSWLKRGSLADYLGFNVVNASDDNWYQFNAFSFMMYIRLMRDFYINKRIYKQYLDSEKESDGDKFDLLSKFMFPRDDADFRIGTSQWDAIFTPSAIEEGVPTFTDAQVDAIETLLSQVWYRDWTQDFFTTALTSPVIGETDTDIIKLYAKDDVTVPVTYNRKGVDDAYFPESRDNMDLPYLTSGFRANVTSEARITTGLYATTNNSSQYPQGNRYFTSHSADGTDLGTYSSFYGSAVTPFDWDNGKTVNFTTDHKKDLAFFESMIGLSGSLTMDALRNLACASAILEKMAKNDGSYREFGKSFFGVTPSSAQNFTPKYIGGTYAPIVFTDVVNTGSSQGDITGKAICGNGGRLGSSFFDDYGICMSLFSITPDTYYSQGLRKQDFYETADDYYLPERAKLGMTAIVNAEIYNDLSDSTRFTTVFGYQNRFDELRYRANEVHGKVADPLDNTFRPYISQRIFSECPTLTPSFLNMKGTVDESWKSSEQEVGYFVQMLNGCSAVRPVPYIAVENNMGF